MADFRKIIQQMEERTKDGRRPQLKTLNPKAFEEINQEFHQQWGEEKSLPSYDKSTWIKRQRRLNAIGIGV